MKNYFVLTLVLLGLTTFGQDEIVKINNESIAEDYFLSIYTKNNEDPNMFNIDSLRSGLDLFINFQLIVAEAKAQGLDQDPKFVQEYTKYRDQIAKGYLIDSAQIEALVNEAYAHMTEEVEASHILIRIGGTGSPEDTLAAYNEIISIRNAVLNGADFGALAQSKSADQSARQNKGYLGYFSAFQMVYQFEKAAFETTPGEMSMPFRTRFGYHIVKVHNKIPGRGTMEGGLIYISAGPSATPSTWDDAKKEADMVYQKLQEGADFGDMAFSYSDEPESAKNKGRLRPFGVGTKGRLFPEIENTLYGLENDGDVAAPIKLMGGYWILKRIKLSPLKSFDEMKETLFRGVKSSDRSAYTEQKFLERLKKEYNLQDLNNNDYSWLTNSMDDTIFFGRQMTIAVEDPTKVVFTFGDVKVTRDEIAQDLLINQKRQAKISKTKYAEDFYLSFIDKKIYEHQKDLLPNKYPDYRLKIQEFYDGILKFNFMMEEVWNKAGKDTTGLAEFYEANKGTFVWPTRYKGKLIRVESKEALAAIKQANKEGVSIDSLQYYLKANGFSGSQVKNAKYDEADLANLGFSAAKLKEGYSKPVNNQEVYYIFFLEEVLEPEQQTMENAKGIILSAYQKELEVRLIAMLREKYNIIINEETLNSLAN